MAKRLFSGIQPTGIIHLGNYFGAIHNWLELQNEYDSIFSIVDLHALTTFQTPEELNKNIKNLAKLYLACGLDPKKNIIYRQSDVPAHTGLTWILNCITPLNELEKMTQFKDKSKKNEKNINAGLLTYPVLMAADILLYDTEIVPVGEDQIQHVELTKIIAKKFNNKYGESFIIPEPKVNKISARLKGLDNPANKMSKSATSPNNYIALLDEPEVIRKKIKKAVTDSGTTIEYSDKKPALKNLIDIYSLVTGQETKNIVKSFEGKGYGEFKQDLAEKIVDFITPIQEKFKAIKDNEIEMVLNNGAKLANELAEKKLKQIKHNIGL